MPGMDVEEIVGMREGVCAWASVLVAGRGEGLALVTATVSLGNGIGVDVSACAMICAVEVRVGNGSRVEVEMEAAVGSGEADGADGRLMNRLPNQAAKINATTSRAAQTIRFDLLLL